MRVEFIRDRQRFGTRDELGMIEFNRSEKEAGRPYRACSACGDVVNEIAQGWNDRGWLRGAGPGGFCGQCRGVSAE